MSDAAVFSTACRHGLMWIKGSAGFDAPRHLGVHMGTTASRYLDDDQGARLRISAVCSTRVGRKDLAQDGDELGLVIGLAQYLELLAL